MRTRTESRAGLQGRAISQVAIIHKTRAGNFSGPGSFIVRDDLLVAAAQPTLVACFDRARPVPAEGKRGLLPRRPASPPYGYEIGTEESRFLLEPR